MATQIEVAISSQRTEMNWHRSQLVGALDRLKANAAHIADREERGITSEEQNITKFAADVERHCTAIAVLRDTLRSLEAIRDAKDVY